MSYIIGTRASLLAQTQARWIAQSLRKRGLECQIKLIKTRGDVQDQAPLWQLQGKDFFTKELDSALLAGEIDLSAHSCKDIGTVRPPGIQTAAITKRDYAQDVLLVKGRPAGKLRVGTSSPRRAAQVGSHLKELLPDSPEVQCLPLRGNVTTRLAKLREGEFDAIGLALAGLERLAGDEQARGELEPLLAGLDYMVLPPSLFPPAPAQGALGIEIATSAPAQLRQALGELDHRPTREEVERERAAFRHYGGGCHLAVGIFVKGLPGGGFVHIERGEVDGQIIDQHRLNLERPACRGRVFVGLAPAKAQTLGDELIAKVAIDASPTGPSGNQALMVASTHCLPALKRFPPETTLIAAGVQTHRRLAAAGRWVHLGADGRGEEEVAKLLTSRFLQMIRPITGVRVLSNDEARSTLGPVLPCYRRQLRSPGADFARRVEQTKCFYWTSFPQYQLYCRHFPCVRPKQHACGLGKTWQAFRREGIAVIPFASMDEFLAWAGIPLSPTPGA